MDIGHCRRSLDQREHSGGALLPLQRGSGRSGPPREGWRAHVLCGEVWVGRGAKGAVAREGGKGCVSSSPLCCVLSIERPPLLPRRASITPAHVVPTLPPP